MTDGEFDNLTVNNVLTIGADTNLYRSAANVLKTDDTLEISPDVHNLLQTGGNQNQVIIRRDANYVYISPWGTDTMQNAVCIGGGANCNLRVVGQIQAPVQGGSGGLLIGGDTNLYRSAPNILKTDDKFVANEIQVGSSVLSTDQYGSIELGDSSQSGTVPYIDFHYGKSGSEDFNVRLQNYGDKLFAITAISSGGTLKLVNMELAFEGDTKLYRSAPNTLATNSIIESQECWQHLSKQQFITAIDGHEFLDTTGKIKFYDIYEFSGEHKEIVLHGVMSGENPTLVCSQTLAVEIDFIAKGMLNSLEGEVVLNGGNYAPYWSWQNRTTGGVPSTANPFIWLAQGGIYGNYGTLEIRVTADANGNWNWGDLACGNLTLRGFTDHDAFVDISVINFTDNWQSVDRILRVKGRYGGWDGATKYHVVFTYNNGSCDTDIFQVSESGAIVGHDKLYLSGNTNGYLWNNGGYIRQSGGNGFVADGTVTVGTYASGGTGSAVHFNSYHQLCQGTSLRACKTNIETVDDASWIYNLRPVTFDWKNERDAQVFGRQIGLIAEEVQPYAPLLTFNDEQTGQLRGIMYEKLAVPMLVEMQKLRREVDELKAKLVAA